MGLRFFDEFGNSIDILQWRRLVEKPDVWQMRDEVPDGYVSTAYLGHDFDGINPPRIYETAVFGGPLDRQVWKWATMAQATVGHMQVLKWVEGRDHAVVTVP